MVKVLKELVTETANNKSMLIDRLDTEAMIRLINNEDQCVIHAISQEVKTIALAVDAAYEIVNKGGRLIYIGAGTSGRLGVLDASECLPTFGVGEESIIAIIAGGDKALRYPVELAEDNTEAIIDDLKRIRFNAQDILCAIAASGRTPYCLSGLQYARTLGAKTISIACVQDSELSQVADYPIEVVVGPEVITGSTRMKAGSAQKMVLNMLSTGVMVKLGKVYGNLMVDVKPTNDKLIKRALQMIMTVTGCDDERAKVLLELSGQRVKIAIIMEIKGVNQFEAEALLKEYQGRLSWVLQS